MQLDLNVYVEGISLITGSSDGSAVVEVVGVVTVVVVAVGASALAIVLTARKSANIIYGK